MVLVHFSDCIKKQPRAGADVGCAGGIAGRGVCINNSQVTSVVSGTSCGPG